MGSGTGKEIVLRFVEAINNHDVDEIVFLMAPDHIFIDGLGNTQRGKQGMKEGWNRYFELFPDYKIEIIDLLENDPLIGVFGFAGGTYKSNKGGSESNFWSTTASWKALVENNKIKHWQVYCDYSKLFAIIDKNK